MANRFFRGEKYFYFKRGKSNFVESKLLFNFKPGNDLGQF